MSSYRPNYGAPPPPPPHDLPPLPYGPPPTGPPVPYGDRRNFRNHPIPPQYSLPQSNFSFQTGDSVPQYSLPQSDFSFRIGASAPHYPQIADTYRPTPNYQQPANNNFQRDGKGQRRGDRAFRGRGPKITPSARPLLQQRDGEDSQEQSLGVDLDMQKYLPIDDISESDEDRPKASLSGSENETGVITKGDDLGQEPPAKRRELVSNGATNGESVPKWSNPDPYSVLPPIDDAHRKRRDPVAFIRKGFKPADEKTAVQSQVIANDDFISFEDDAHDSTAPSSHSHSESRASPDHTVLDISDHEEVLDPSAVDESVLGSRKRTHDDNIKPGKRPNKGPRKQFSGSLLEAWIPRRSGEATPWYVKETSSIISPGFRLHREICDFYEFVKPQQHEYHVRQALLSRLQDLIARELPGCTVHCFGSFAAGLYLPNADMDVVINSNIFNNTGEKAICQSRSKLWKFGNFMRDSQIAQEDSVEVVAGAKVPIIKFVDRLTALKVDVSFENATGIVANNTFSAWKRQYPAVPILVAIIKQFLMMRGLNEVQFGGLGGFSVTCLVVSLLQNMPRIQTRSLIPDENLGEVLIEFLDFYGNRIDINRTGIMMNPPGYFDKQARDRANLRGQVYNQNPQKLAIIDPNQPTNDISGGSKNVTLIFERFARAHVELLKAMKTQNRPILLDWMLGGNYESFAWHRARLLKVYKNDDVESIHINLPKFRLPDDQILIDVQAESTTQTLNVTRASTTHPTFSDEHSKTQPKRPTARANNEPKIKLAPLAGNSQMSGFERWTTHSRLRTFENPQIDLDSPHRPHILAGKPTLFADTAPPSKPGTYGTSARFPYRISDRMASPSNERRKEVTRHFSGCSSIYPIELD